MSQYFLERLKAIKNKVKLVEAGNGWVRYISPTGQNSIIKIRVITNITFRYHLLNV